MPADPGKTAYLDNDLRLPTLERLEISLDLRAERKDERMSLNPRRARSRRFG
jgi:hypothetical protein